MMDLGTRLKNLRLERRLSQRNLATLVGCSHQAIATFERNENSGRIKTLEKLCCVFDVTADYLINGVQFECHKEITTKEMQMILKYRALSDYYKSMVDHIIELGENSDIHSEKW